MRRGKDRKGKERKGKERKGKERSTYELELQKSFVSYPRRFKRTCILIHQNHFCQGSVRINPICYFDFVFDPGTAITMMHNRSNNYNPMASRSPNVSIHTIFTLKLCLVSEPTIPMSDHRSRTYLLTSVLMQK